MKKSRFNGLKDYLALAVRRKWLIAAAAIVFAGFAALFAAIIPDIYVSRSMILIQQRDIPSEFVKDLIAGDTEQRLSAIEKMILSRTNLLKILSEFESDLAQYRGLNDERKVENLKKKIKIDFPSEKVRGAFLPISNITIAYSDRNPELAQKITGRLTTLFIEQDSRTREEQVYGTTEFLRAELAKVAEQLKESETNLQALKGRHRYELPEERDTNLRALDRLQLDRNSNIEALDRYMTMKLTIEQQMAETPQLLPREQVMRETGAPIPSPEVQAYRQKERQYKELIARAKETHPEVRRLKAELEQLKKDLPPGALDAPEEKPAPGTAGVSPASDMVPNPLYQERVRQLQQVKTEIDIRERGRKWIESEMKNYEQRVQNTPKVEQEVTAVERANLDLMKQHEDLKNKLSQARLAESAESKQKGQQFVVIDPANYPLEPAPPKRSAILLVGLVISIVLGIAAAYVVDAANQTVITQSELERALDAQVLIEIPRISTPEDLSRKRKRSMMYAAAFVASLVVYVGFLYLLYIKQNALLTLLDPLIERLRS